MKNVYAVKAILLHSFQLSLCILAQLNLQNSANVLVEKKQTCGKTFKQTGSMLCQSDQTRVFIKNFWERFPLRHHPFQVVVAKLKQFS